MVFSYSCENQLCVSIPNETVMALLSWKSVFSLVLQLAVRFLWLIITIVMIVMTVVIVVIEVIVAIVVNKTRAWLNLHLSIRSGVGVISKWLFTVQPLVALFFSFLSSLLLHLPLLLSFLWGVGGDQAAFAGRLVGSFDFVIKAV